MLLKFLGWRVEGRLPETPRFVLIAAPHTSNWDGFYMILAAFVFRINLYWMGKHTLFKFPFGFLTGFIGGIPINRSKSSNTVKQTISAINDASNIVMAVSPEGTRKKVHYWRTGFYHIAQGAKVPILTGFLDYRNKRAGIGPAIIPTGDLKSDFEKIQAFYDPIAGKYPREVSTSRLESYRLP